MRLCNFLLGIAAISATGCASNYKDVSETDPHATLIIQRNLEGTKGDNEPYQIYRVVENRKCDGSENLAGFSFGKEYLKTRRVTGDKPIKILAHAGRMRVASYSYTQYATVPNYDSDFCWTYSEFTPLTGKTYTVSHSYDGEGESCGLIVIDRDTGEAPEDFATEGRFHCEKD